MAQFRYPTDTDQFAEIREKGLYYVDKTELIYKLVNNHKYVFLARPRRFGKSLLCTTLKEYFEGKKDLFEGLAIPLLYQSGYLSIDCYDSMYKIYTLHFPNKEVRHGMVEIMSHYLKEDPLNLP